MVCGMSASQNPPRLSPRLSRVRPSPTLAMDAAAKALAARGADVVSLAAGEPDFDTPAHVKEAAAQALAAGKTKYTPASGTPELRRAVADDLARLHGLTFA